MGRVEYLLCHLTDSEAEQWSYLMRGDSGQAFQRQAFQRLMLSCSGQRICQYTTRKSG